VALPRPFRDTSRGERVLAVALLGALVMAWWWVGGQPARMPRLVSAVAGGSPQPGAAPANVARMGGLGRFAKLRTERARRLS
jgi:hypothetical protein